MNPFNRIGARDRRAILFGVLLLGGLLGYQYALQPFIASWQDARQTIRLAEQQRSQRKTQQLRLAAEQAQLSRVYGPGVSKPLEPAHDVRIGFVKTVDDLLRGAGLASQGNRDLPLRQAPGAVLVGLQVEATGQQQQLAQCLAKMSQSPTLIYVETLNASVDPRKGQQLSVTMVLWTIAREEPK